MKKVLYIIGIALIAVGIGLVVLGFVTSEFIEIGIGFSLVIISAAVIVGALTTSNSDNADERRTSLGHKLAFLQARDEQPDGSPRAAKKTTATAQNNPASVKAFITCLVIILSIIWLVYYIIDINNAIKAIKEAEELGMKIKDFDMFKAMTDLLFHLLIPIAAIIAINKKGVKE